MRNAAILNSQIKVFTTNVPDVNPSILFAIIFGMKRLSALVSKANTQRRTTIFL
jgi:hypothetical protein